MYFAKLDALLKSCFSIPATATKSSLPCYIFCNKFPINKRECEIIEIPFSPFCLFFSFRHFSYFIHVDIRHIVFPLASRRGDV